MAFIKAGLWGPEAIIDATGHALPGATAAVYLTDGVTLASLWTTSAKSVSMANPTQADIHANLHFYADPGQYRLKVNVGTVVTWLDVEVPIDPGEAAQDQDVVAAQAAAEAYADGIVAAGLATKQPLDSDLTAIAALSTTAFGRGLLILADAAAGRAAFGSVIGTDVQAHDSDLDAIAALATTAFGRALLVLADAAALRTAAGLGSAATHASTDFDAAGAASAAVTALVAGAPGALDTLNELATALADDANFATTITNALAGKQQAVARTAVKTTNYLAAAGDLVPVDTTSGAVTVTLPNAPTDKSTIAVKHIIQGGTNVVTIACAGADVFNRAGGGTSATLPYANQAMLLEYTAAGAIWSVIADDLPLSQLDLRFAPITGIPESAVTSLATDLAAKAPILAPTAVKTGNYTAAVGDYVLCDTSGGIFTVTLPTAPADKTSIAVDLVASGNTLTIARGGADVFQKAGGPTSLTMNTANRVLVLQYQSSTAVWHVQDHLPAVITTKGDLLTYSTERARLAVGADGALLGADSTQTTGLKWIPLGTYARIVQPPPKVWFDPTVGADSGDVGYSVIEAGQVYAPFRTLQGAVDAIPYIVDGGARAWAAAEIAWRGQSNYDYAIGDIRLPVIPLASPLYLPRHVKLKLGRGNVAGGRAQCQVLANFAGPMLYPNIGNDIEGGVWTNSHASGDGICLTVLKTLGTEFGNLVGRDLHLRGMAAYACGRDGWALSSNWIDRAVIEDFAALLCGRSGMRLTPDDASSGTSTTPKMAQDFTLRNGLINNCGTSTDAQFHAAGSSLAHMGGGAGIRVEHLTIFQDAVANHYEYIHLEGMANIAFSNCYLEDAAAIRQAPMITLAQSLYDVSDGALTDGGMWNHGVSFESCYIHPNRYDTAAGGLSGKAWLFDVDAAFGFRYGPTNVIHGGSGSLTGTQAAAPTAANPLFWLHNTHGVKNADIDARIATNYYRSTQWGQTPGSSAIVKDDN